MESCCTSGESACGPLPFGYRAGSNASTKGRKVSDETERKQAFERQLLIFTAITAARCAAALDRAGLLTADDRKSFDEQLALVSGKADQINHQSHQAWLDLLLSLLPSPKSEDKRHPNS